MKTSFTRTLMVFTVLFITSVLIFSCNKNSNNSSDQPRLQLTLSDNPPVGIKEVWVDIKQVEIIVGDSARPVILDGVHAGVYNLLELTGGKDTLLADALIPAGTISQIRLILGDNNYIVSPAGDKIMLKTPSAQQSGLKVQLHQDVTGGVLYRLALDFDVARSIVFAGNSSNVILKPVLRVLSFVPSGGNISGAVLPDSVVTSVIAIRGTDTIASAFTNPSNGGYLLKDVPAGNYTLSFMPTDTTYKTVQKNALVVLGQTTIVDTVQLQH
ncbi:MAG: hypothetical protein JWR61_2848 [Ferruginibacter sp.]|uniref:DUF4382 domain-containing protein n=1 Tax=Ferruginibacter sp. TaxID=1940288 RepID=UPI002659E9E8|nr:DUF4382 domain-containing protein [Ferruginibacter sp.]MDB5277893.1 hypothetical protein [Ferruginibacter sp.]